MSQDVLKGFVDISPGFAVSFLKKYQRKMSYHKGPTGSEEQPDVFTVDALKDEQEAAYIISALKVLHEHESFEKFPDGYKILGGNVSEVLKGETTPFYIKISNASELINSLQEAGLYHIKNAEVPGKGYNDIGL